MKNGELLLIWMEKEQERKNTVNRAKPPLRDFLYTSAQCPGRGLCSTNVNEAEETHPGRVTWVVPTGTISIDFPQNLFLHLTSAKKLSKWTLIPDKQVLF